METKDQWIEDVYRNRRLTLAEKSRAMFYTEFIRWKHTSKKSERTGEVLILRDDGRYCYFTMKEGIKDGVEIIYNKSGKVASVQQFKDGEPDGWHVDYYYHGATKKLYYVDREKKYKPQKL